MANEYASCKNYYSIQDFFSRHSLQKKHATPQTEKCYKCLGQLTNLFLSL